MQVVTAKENSKILIAYFSQTGENHSAGTDSRQEKAKETVERRLKEIGY